jgi:ribulose kinase
MTALGEYADINTAVQNMVKISTIFEPNKDYAEIYRKRHAVYRSACEQLKGVRLSDL